MSAAAGVPPPRVLVLMATRNGAPWIAEQLRSIFEQDGVRCTLVLRDDASTDATPAAVDAACAGHDRVRVIAAITPSGSAAANFFALMRAADPGECDYVALADQDDVWRPDKLARAIACLERSGAAGCSAPVQAFWTDGRTAVLRQHPVPTAADHLFEGAGQGCTFVLRADFFRKVRSVLVAHPTWFDRLHYHDWTLYALCRQGGERWAFDDQVALDYRQHDGNDTGARHGLAAIRKRLALVRSGWYRAQIDGIVRLCSDFGGASAGAARDYRRLADAAGARRAARIPLCAFVLRHGRRRKTDRLLLAWAALAGHLSRAPGAPWAHPFDAPAR